LERKIRDRPFSFFLQPLMINPSHYQQVGARKVRRANYMSVSNTAATFGTGGSVFPLKPSGKPRLAGLLSGKNLAACRPFLCLSTFFSNGDLDFATTTTRRVINALI
jgi:hypothetical protein